VLPICDPKQRQSYFGGLNGITGELVVKAAPKADSTHTITFLEPLRIHYPSKQIRVIWDNASYHKSQLVKEYLQQLHQDWPEEKWLLTLISLATNAPEQNPIEQVWLEGKTQLRKQADLKNVRPDQESLCRYHLRQHLQL
jgi:transposase